MTKNWDKQFNVRDHAQHEIQRRIDQYINEKRPFNDFMDVRESIMMKVKEEKLPGYVIEGLYEYWRGYFEAYSKGKLIFMYQWDDGNFYSMKELEARSDFSHVKLATMRGQSGTFWDNTHPYFTGDRT